MPPSLTKECPSCGERKLHKYFAAKQKKCKDCVNAEWREKRAEEKALNDKVKEAVKKQHAVYDKLPTPEEAEALIESVDALEAYAERVSEDAPKRLAAAIAGMRTVAIELAQPTSESRGTKWGAFTTLHKQCQDILVRVYGSESMDIADRVFEKVRETAEKRRELGW